MEFRIIKSPSKGALDIIVNRANLNPEETIPRTDAIGLVQGRMIDMMVAADIAYKMANVTVCDIKGICPQNMILIGIFGDTASVESAISSIRADVEEKTCLRPS